MPLRLTAARFVVVRKLVQLPLGVASMMSKGRSIGLVAGSRSVFERNEANRHLADLKIVAACWAGLSSACSREAMTKPRPPPWEITKL